MRTTKYLVSILFILSISVNFFSQDYRAVQDGIEYAGVTKEISGLNVNINLLRLDLTKVRLDVVHAMDEAIGVEKTSSLAARYGAIAAINAGFFRLDGSIYLGDSNGVLVIDKWMWSESKDNRIALFIGNRNGTSEISMAHIDATAFFSIGKAFRKFSGINRERKENESILYRPEFGRTTLTSPGGTELVVQNDKVVKIVEGGSTLIPKDGYVISLSGTARDEVKPLVKIGTRIKSNTAVQHSVSPTFPNTDSVRTSQAFDMADDVVGGTPQLIRNGKIDITWEQEKSSKSFVETRHPRTAVARLKDGKFLMVTVDGRSESSGGIGLQDLAEYLLSIGAVDAMNLDGGGSTTMVVDGKVVNHPSDKEGERKVSDALIVRKR